MIADDPFSQYYAEFLDETYDVVDRIVLNAYFPMGTGPGGFRVWWRALHDGSEEQLDNVHLLRLAGRFARRVRGWARKHQIPVVCCKAAERKHEVAHRYLPKDQRFEGIFAVLVARAPAPVWEVLPRSERGGLHIRRKNPMPWVNHYYFHILDAEWGHLTIRMCGQPPFSAKVMLNGHEYVACRARKAGIAFVKEGNCFTSSASGLTQIAETLRTRAAVGRLRQACERWIYRCVCFGLSFDEQKKTNFRYSYSVYQLEYSRNLLFTRGRQMDQVFDGVVDRTRAPLDIKTLKTIFGYKHRPFSKKRTPRFEVVIERPAYNLTVFKVHFGKITLKMYTKGERVLRIEAIVHNTGALRCGRILERFGDIVRALKSMLERFLRALRCVDVCAIADDTLDELPMAGQVGSTRVGGVDINQPRIRAVLRAVIALSLFPDGFTSAQLAQCVSAILGDSYSPRQAAYDLKKLRSKNLVHFARRRPYYEPSSEGLRTVTALLVLRDKVIKPILTGASRPQAGRRPNQRAAIDEHYERLQNDMRALFAEMRLAAA
jgi:hypothetical protein